MQRDCVAAVVQLNSADDLAANLASAQQQVAQAAAAGAELIVLPELFTCLGNWPALVAGAELLEGPTSEQLSQWAARHRITLVAGSIAERDPASGKALNCCQVFLPDGQRAAVYRKLHLFDVEIPGRVRYCESQWLAAGNEVVVCDTPCGRLGLAICYDVRFPALFERLVEAGSEIIALPAAFTAVTGRDHWELLVRARAVESQVYLLAANQWGRHAGEAESFGHSMIVDPWGQVLAQVADGVGLATARLDAQRWQEIRARLPALEHRRKLPAALR